MIPSEMPVLSQSRGENGHASFADNSNVFQNQQDVFRSGIFGQLGSEQMQMLQNLQQMGQKVKKEVGHFLLPHVRSERVVFCVLASPVLCHAGSASLLLCRCGCFCLVKRSPSRQKGELLPPVGNI